ncbi:MAG TPA: hypothetical protein VGJ84_10725 [Polyangiaceae bacterium]
MKRQKRLTKRERRELNPNRQKGQNPGADHIHCIACGRHIHPGEFSAPASATYVQCKHGTRFPACVGCTMKAEALLADHDRTGQAVKPASAWH